MAITIISKICSNCSQTKPVTDFYKSKICKDGYFGQCIDCVKQKKRVYVENLRKRTEFPELTEKYCPSCKTIFPISNFDKNKTKRNGFTEYCKSCRYKYDPRYKGTRINQKRNLPSKNKREYRLLYKYGINTEIFKKMVAKQNSCCAICGKKVKENEFHVDHCHKTNKVRGLLCPNCNFGLGFFKDNISALQEAIKYLSEQ